MKLLLLALAAAWQASGAGESMKVRGDGDTEVRRKPVVEFVMAHYEGTVTDVGASSITVDGAGAARIWPNPEIEGKKGFGVSRALAAGGYERGASYGDRYRLQDVCKGDRVHLNFSRIDGVDICTHISIMRRPGGRVPPCPDDDPRLTYPHHVTMNIYQDRDEKGIPLPPEFMPPWLKLPVAPAPREVRRPAP